MVALILIFGHLCGFIFLNLQSFHYFLSLLVFVHHDVTHTKIGDYNRSQAEHVVCVLVYHRLIISYGFVVLLKHEENVAHIQLPCLMVSAKLCGLPEKFFDNCIVFLIPVNLGLRHEDRNILLQTFVKFL